MASPAIPPDSDPRRATTWPATLGVIAAWIWTAAAAGGGVMLMIERGPWPLTNGWFALASGLAACPATAWLAERVVGTKPSGRNRFAAAALFWIAGQIARRITG